MSESSSDEFEFRYQATPMFRSEELEYHGKFEQSIPESRKRSSNKVTARLANRTTRSFEQPHPSIESTDEFNSKGHSTSTGSPRTSRTPPTAIMTSENLSSISRNSSEECASWSHLPEKLQFYLEYHTNHINHHSYFFKHRSDHFLHVILLSQALIYEPLLFAVVGFAAFRIAVTSLEGKIEDFLEYYNVAVTGLRRSLAAGQAYTEPMLLTMLQLATFEVYAYRPQDRP